MRTWLPVRVILGELLFVALGCAPLFTSSVFAEQTGLGDNLWVWANPEMTTAGLHGAATFAQAGPAERASLLGVPNIVMAGEGLPADDAAARELLRQSTETARIVLEIVPDGQGESRPYVYTETVARVRRLAADDGRIEGVLLDDMTSIGIDKGFRPEHIRGIREALEPDHDRLKVWGVVYTMNLDRPGIEDYLRELDVINLWTWHAKDTVNLEANVARCEKMCPGKPIVLGLYLHDYGDSRSMPADLLAGQCSTALELAKAGRVAGIVFLTIDNEPAAIEWTADWVRDAVGQAADPAAGAEDFRLTSAGAQWDFSGDAWAEKEDGVIRPPDQRNLHSRAFRTDRAYRDFTAEFEFNGDYRETGTGSAGLVFGATDPNHFRYLWFPWGGQQLRAKHFWAALAKVDGDGFIRNAAMEWVPGVPSETDRWYKVRVEVQGERVRVWVDGVQALDVSDAGVGEGCLGFAGYGWYAFRNLRVTGATVPAPSWDSSATFPVHSFPLGLGSKTMPTACIAPNGDVLLAAGAAMLRSSDKGRTWSEPQALPATVGELSDYGSTMFRTSRGRLMIMVYRTQEAMGKAVPEIAVSESNDNGVTWSEPVPAIVAPEWPAVPKNLVPYGPLVETGDGTLIRFLLGGVKEENDTFTDVLSWSATHCKAFAIRSTDGGQNWSAPIEIDQPSWVGKPRGTIPGSLDLTEPTGVAMGNALLVLVRPIYSPTMWVCRSTDAGVTWDAAARATFAGYAQSMVRTASGNILCAHRYPHYSVNMSRDGGLNWDAGTVIDFPVWAMGTALEVEPDVILFTYMNADQSAPLLGQLVRVTDTGLVPLDPKAGW